MCYSLMFDAESLRKKRPHVTNVAHLQSTFAVRFATISEKENKNIFERTLSINKHFFSTY